MKISKIKYDKIINYPKNLGIFIDKLLKKKPKDRPNCSEILEFSEFKKFQTAEAEEKQLSIKERRKKLIFRRPISLGNNSFKETVYKRDHRRASPSIVNKGKYNYNNKNPYKEDYTPTSIYSKEFKCMSPQPQNFFINRKILENHKLIKDSSAKLLHPMAFDNFPTNKSIEHEKIALMNKLSENHLRLHKSQCRSSKSIHLIKNIELKTNRLQIISRIKKHDIFKYN